MKNASLDIYRQAREVKLLLLMLMLKFCWRVEPHFDIKEENLYVCCHCNYYAQRERGRGNVQFVVVAVDWYANCWPFACILVRECVVMLCMMRWWYDAIKGSGSDHYSILYNLMLNFDELNIINYYIYNYNYSLFVCLL